MFSTKPKTVADVLTVFTKTIDDLHAVATTQAGEAGRQHAIAQTAQEAGDAALAESILAGKTATKLKAFLA